MPLEVVAAMTTAAKVAMPTAKVALASQYSRVDLRCD
jgi:hypothetical protein